VITLITGAPGAGKTAALVDLLRGLAEQRAIYVDGIPDLRVTHIDMKDARAWPEEVPDGAAVVIDEVQRVWRPAGSGAKVPRDIELLETHRHRGLDFFIVTQHPNLIHSNVRRLVGRHIHLRDVGLLGRWWYEWPECSDPAQFRNAPVKKRYTLPTKAFGLYKSASMHVKPIRSIPRSVIVLAVAVVACVALAWQAYASVSGRLVAAKDQEQQVSQKGAGQAAAAAPQTATAGPVTSPPSSASEPSADQAPKVVGCVSAKDYCRCFDAQGFPMRVEWELCKTSAVGFNGLIPLQLAYPVKPTTAAAAVAAEVVAATAPAVNGFNAGDFRERPPRTGL
jgi:zona occludens toxin